MDGGAFFHFSSCRVNIIENWSFCVSTSENKRDERTNGKIFNYRLTWFSWVSLIGFALKCYFISSYFICYYICLILSFVVAPSPSTATVNLNYYVFLLLLNLGFWFFVLKFSSALFVRETFIARTLFFSPLLNLSHLDISSPDQPTGPASIWSSQKVNK